MLKKKRSFAMSRKKKRQYPDITSTSSATGTTGIMPSMPGTPEEYEAMQELSGMEIPKKGGNG